MKKRILSLLLGALGVLALPSQPAAAFGGGACSAKALALLQQLDTNGYAIVQRVKDNAFFAQWLMCDTRTLGLGLAVHETFHKLDVEKLSDNDHNAYYIGPREVIKVRNYRLFNRSELARYIPAAERDEYYQQYLEGPSGQQDITMVLEELNAYTQGTITDSKLVGYMDENERQSTRDGLATFMYYTELYLKRGREAHPAQWRKLAADPAYVTLIQRLWQRAEETLQPIMGEARLGLRDGAILARVYSPELIGELTQFFQAAKRSFQYNDQIIVLSRQNNEADVTRQPELTSVPSTTQVEVGPGDGPTEGTISVQYNGQPVTRQQMEQMLVDHPELAKNRVFMKLLQTLRQIEAP